MDKLYGVHGKGISYIWGGCQKILKTGRYDGTRTQKGGKVEIVALVRKWFYTFRRGFPLGYGGLLLWPEE